MTQQVDSIWGKLTILEDSNADDIIKKIIHLEKREDAFFVFSLTILIEKYMKWVTLLKNVKPFYAVKCNDHEVMLKVLATLGAGFDCASEVELEKILAIGVDAKNIIFANPCKTTRQLSLLSKTNVMMTFDNDFELRKIKKVFPGAQLLIRIRSDAKICTRIFGNKFGAEPELTQSLLKCAKEMDLNIVGVAFHVGGGCTEDAAYERAIIASRKVFDEAIAIGFQPYILDIGGGFGDSTEYPFERTALAINQALERYFPPEMNIKFMAEPGRYLADYAFALATMVIGKQEIKSDSQSLDTAKYCINDGIYSSFYITISQYKGVHPRYIKDNNQNDLVNATIYGQTCDSYDKVLEERTIPRHEIGDWIIWENMGAYSLTTASNFNGFPIPPVYSVVPLKFWQHLKELSEKEEVFSLLPKAGLLEALDAIKFGDVYTKH